MTTLDTDIITKLFGHGKETPWSVFNDLVTSTYKHEKIDEDKIKQGLEMYKHIYNENVIEQLKTKTHPKLDFLKDFIHGKIETEGEEPCILYLECDQEIDFNSEISHFYKCKFDLLMEIAEVKRLYYCRFFKNEDNFTFSRKLVKARQYWYTSVVQRILRFKKEIDFYKEKGLDSHPVQKVIINWNMGDKILVDEGEKKKILEKEKQQQVVKQPELQPELQPEKQPEKQPESGQEKVLPKREIKKEELPYKKKDEKSSFVLEKIPKFEFINDVQKGGSKLLVM